MTAPGHASAASGQVLSARGIRKAYRGVVALDGVSIELPAAGITGLILIPADGVPPEQIFSTLARSYGDLADSPNG